MAKKVKAKKVKTQKTKENSSIILDALKGSQLHIAHLELQNVDVFLANLETQKGSLEEKRAQKLEAFKKLTADLKLPSRFNLVRNDNGSYSVISLPPQPQKD